MSPTKPPKPVSRVYVVESHLGGTYLSDAEPEVIEEVCSSCGDSDWIIGSFESGDEDSAVVALAEAYCRDLWWDTEVEDGYTEEDVADIRGAIDEVSDPRSLARFVNMLDEPRGRYLPSPAVPRFISLADALRADLTADLEASLADKRASYKEGTALGGSRALKL